MKKTSPSSQNIAADDLMSGVVKGSRLSDAHLDFSTEQVKLAFGQSKAGKIVHVHDVPRGLSCGCTCPACGEDLVARQGDLKSWHFAHSSGSACKGAYTAALAALLVQVLSEGRLFNMPDLDWSWGKSRRKQSMGRFAILGASVHRNSASGLFEVVGAPADGRVGGAIRISFIEAGVRQFKSDGNSDETPHLSLVLPRIEDIGQGEEAIIDFVIHQLLVACERHWRFHPLVLRERRTCTEKYLRRHLDAYAAMDFSQLGHKSEDLVRRLGFESLLCTDPIDGEIYLAPSSRGWRSAVLSEVVLAPAIYGRAEMPLSEVAFGHREVTRVMARERLVRSAALMQPLDHDSTEELLRIIPDLRRPIQVVEAYLHQLWVAGVVDAKPKTRSVDGRTGGVDQRLAALTSQNWILSSRALAQVRRFIPEPQH